MMSSSPFTFCVRVTLAGWLELSPLCQETANDLLEKKNPFLFSPTNDYRLIISSCSSSMFLIFIWHTRFVPVFYDHLPFIETEPFLVLPINYKKVFCLCTSPLIHYLDLLLTWSNLLLQLHPMWLWPRPYLVVPLVCSPCKGIVHHQGAPFLQPHAQLQGKVCEPLTHELLIRCDWSKQEIHCLLKLRRHK